MQKARKLLSLMLSIAFFTTILGDISMPQVRADSLITLSVQKDASLQDKITDSSVTLEWNQVFGAKSYKISYQDYADDNIGVAKSVYTDITKTNYEITDLEPNVVYSFTLEAMSDLNGQGNSLASDNLKVLTAISFMSSDLQDTVVQNSFDRETGTRPAMKLQWSIPKMWDGSKFDFVSSSLLNYKVTVGVTKAATDAGTYNIKYNGASYEVYKENLPSDVKLAYAPLTMVGGQISYEWRFWDPVNNVVNDATIKPGTIYYMKIMPQFSNLVGKVEYRISTLSNGYAPTPLHVKVGKDSNNNIVCTIYRINYDDNNGQSKINFKYEVYSSPDSGMASPSLEGYEYEQYGDPALPIEIFIPEKDQTSTFYYLALAKSDGMDSISSPVIDYNMASDAGRPPIPQDVTVDEIKRVPDTAGGNITKSADITLKWDAPYNFGSTKSNLNFYILLSSAQSDTTDSKGNYYKEVIDDKEYDIKYRLVKIVNGDKIDASETGYLKYTLNGLDLFTADSGAAPISNPVNPDNYPTFLQLNKIYYLKIYTEKVDAGTISDFSVPVSFTTPTKEFRQPPVPQMFNADEVNSDQIRLAWQKSQINLEDYDAEGKAYSVYNEVYMDDDISMNSDGSYKKPFAFLGSSENPLHALFTVGTGENLNVRYATLDQFTGNDQVTQRFGSKVKPNTTYYFKIRTKLYIQGQPDAMYSDFSQILAVTTPKEEIGKPGDNEKVPLAPMDFAVQLDANGNKKVDSYTAAFTWSKKQDNVTYNIARTLKPINMDDDISTLLNGQGYDLNQYQVPKSLKPDSSDKFSYLIQGLWPNTVYYFSINSERDILQDGVTTAVYSSWVTIPVTTFMVEPPDTFELIKDNSYNKYTQVKVNWRAKDYLDYEIWIKTDKDNDYSRWTNITVNSIKPASLQGTSYNMFYATINNLNSNTRYYIKVRNRVSRTVNGSTIYDYSKFVGPLETRTEFSQSDYDSGEKDKQDEIIFNDRMESLNDPLYWTLVNSESTTKVKLRSAKAINFISHGNTDKLVIDLTGLKNNSTEKIIYIPFSVFDYINKNNKLLSIKDTSGEMLFRPKTLDASLKDIDAINKEIGQSGSDIEETFIRVTMKETDSGSASIPSSMKNNISSKAVKFSVDALGMSDIEQNLETKIKAKITSLLQSKLNNYLSKSDTSKDTPQEIDELMQEYIQDCESDLGDYAESETEDLIEETNELTELSNPVQFKLVYASGSAQGQQNAYQYINSKWNKLSTQINTLDGTAVFVVKRPSEVAVFKSSSQSSSSTNSQLNKQFGDLESKYAISEVILTNGTYNGQDIVNFKQIIGVVGKTLGVDTTNNIQDITSNVSKKLGLNSRITSLSQTHLMTREEAAYITAELYAVKAGVSVNNYKPSKAISISDAKQVNPIYYKAVVMAVDLRLISLDSSNRILPRTVISKDDSLFMIRKVLSLTGNI